MARKTKETFLQLFNKMFKKSIDDSTLNKPSKLEKYYERPFYLRRPFLLWIVLDLGIMQIAIFVLSGYCFISPMSVIFAVF